MLGAASAGAGAAASMVASTQPASATDGSALIVGESNSAKATTTITTKKGYGFVGETSANGGIGVGGSDTSTDGGFGLYGSSANGSGIYGSITGDTTGQNAVQGVDDSSGGGFGVQGTSNNGVGVAGYTSADGQYGVEGIDQSSGGAFGVYGTSPKGYGIYGTSSTGYGVYGAATQGTGVYGFSAQPGSSGVKGQAAGGSGVGVNGNADGEDGYGVQGIAAGTGDSYGVYASSVNSYALYVDGTSDFTGAMSKPGGSFKIDHPVDPADKYLFHSFVESDDMKNVYDGTVILDGDGRATVELPEWFEALNRDFRYQLTALLGAAPELHVSALVADGRFSIAGGNAGQKVSWQVTGIRQDVWANSNRIPVEVDKPERDRGRYLHPELFGGEAITALAKARGRGRRHHSNTPTV
jgi:hypothetical protein